MELKTKEGNRPVDKIDSVVLGVELFEGRSGSVAIASKQ